MLNISSFGKRIVMVALVLTVICGSTYAAEPHLFTHQDAFAADLPVAVQTDQLILFHADATTQDLWVGGRGNLVYACYTAPDGSEGGVYHNSSISVLVPQGSMLDALFAVWPMEIYISDDSQ